MQNNQPFSPGDEVRYFVDCFLKHGKIISLNGLVAYISTRSGNEYIAIEKLKLDTTKQRKGEHR